MQIKDHGTNDWCHLCGNRQDHLVDIWYPLNAEHSNEDTQYIRICSECATLAVKTQSAASKVFIERI